MAPRKAAFIDRDGVINRDHGYVSDWADFDVLPGVLSGLRDLQSLDFQLVVVTNQSGIGRGYYDEASFDRLTQQMCKHFAEQGIAIAGVYFCPHHPEHAEGSYRRACDCRKPAPGMLLRAASEHDLTLADSIMIGDKPSDVAAGRAAGVARCYQVTEGEAVVGAISVPSLAAAAVTEAQFGSQPFTHRSDESSHWSDRAWSLLMLLTTPVWLVLLLREKYRRNADRDFVWQRLGRWPPPTEAVTYWFHAASVGEVMAALPLIEALSTSGVLLTVNTPEAYKLARSRLGDSVQLRYCPIDWPWAIRKLLKAYAPRLLVIIETEIWPALLRESSAAGVQIVIANGRIGDSTLNAPWLIRRLYRRALGCVHRVLARSEQDAAWFEQLGALPDRVQVAGNLKFAACKALMGEDYSHPFAGRDYVVAASTHEGEETAILDWYQAAQSPPLLVLVPRHPFRAAAVAELATARGLRVALHSSGSPAMAGTEVYVVDTTGELPRFCAAAELVLMGGSLVPVGGHNVLEPAALGCATVIGPHYANFAAEVEYLRDKQAIACLPSVEHLPKYLDRLLADCEERQRLGAAATAAIARLPDIEATYIAPLRAMAVNAGGDQR